jgi:hypothetical protein
MRFDVVVLGGINMDYLIRGKILPRPGDTVDGSEFLRAGGGKGANQAVAAARLGARVAFIGRVRGATGTAMSCWIYSGRRESMFALQRVIHTPRRAWRSL